MFKTKCAHCHQPLHPFDFYLERPEGVICSRCIVEHRIPVRSSALLLESDTEHAAISNEQHKTQTDPPLSHPTMEQALVHELKNLLQGMESV